MATSTILVEFESETLDGDALAHLVQTFFESRFDTGVDYVTVKEIDGLGA
jgi:hypothetical protein